VKIFRGELKRDSFREGDNGGNSFQEEKEQKPAGSGRGGKGLRVL